MSESKKSRVVIVDDHPLVRKGIAARLALEGDIELVGEAATEAEALALAKATRPDLMVIDIKLKEGDGIELVKQIKARFSSIRMLVFSGFEESLYAERALRAGASGYLNKQEESDGLIEAVRTVLEGGRHVSRSLMRKLISQALGGSEPVATPLEVLSDREMEIFRMIGEGAATRVIAQKLFLSIHTVDTHRENIKRKLGLKSGAELTRAAVEWVIVGGTSSLETNRPRDNDPEADESVSIN